MALHKADGKRSAVEYVKSVSYPLLGTTITVTDEVDVSLVKPRPRKYEQAGAANTTAAEK